MSVDGLEKSKDDPGIHGQDMKITGNRDPNDWEDDRADTEDHDFDWRGIFGGKTEGSGILVVDFMDIFVQRTPVHSTVSPVVPCVLADKKDSNLISHCEPIGEGNASLNAEKLCHRVEEPISLLDLIRYASVTHIPDDRKLDHEMSEEHEFGTGPLFL